jgi:hypothetical protein
MTPRRPLITRVKYRIAMTGRRIRWIDTMIVIPMHVAGMRIMPRRVVGMYIDASRVVDKSIIPSRVADLSMILNGG